LIFSFQTFYIAPKFKDLIQSDRNSQAKLNALLILSEEERSFKFVSRNLSQTTTSAASQIVMSSGILRIVFRISVYICYQHYGFDFTEHFNLEDLSAFIKEEKSSPSPVIPKARVMPTRSSKAAKKRKGSEVVINVDEASDFSLPDLLRRVTSYP
jgi:hypothetical protein